MFIVKEDPEFSPQTFGGMFCMVLPFGPLGGPVGYQQTHQVQWHTYMSHRVQVSYEDGLGGEYVLPQKSLWGQRTADSDGPGPLGFLMNCDLITLGFLAQNNLVFHLSSVQVPG